MDIALALRSLRPLLQSPAENFEAIRQLLDSHARQTEGELLRAYAASALRPEIEARLASPSLIDRVRALQLASTLFDRNELARLLRRLINDRHERVRRAALSLARLHWFDEVAPDFRPGHGERWLPFWNIHAPLWRAGGEPRHVPQILRLSPLPRSLAELRQALGVDEAQVARLTRPGAGPGSPYVAFTVPKASGGERTLYAPRRPLKAVQRALLARWLAPVPVHEACHGFCRGRSVLTNAHHHQRAALLVKTDISDFFPSIHHHRIVGLFTQLGACPEVAREMAALTTHRPTLAGGKVDWPGLLPQGAPSSPAIANLLCRRLDSRLSGLARRMEAQYTRYADDLTFSFASEPDPGALGRFFWWVNAILQQEGFAENVKKRRVLRRSGRQQVTGVVVNEGPRLPREERRRFKAILNNCERHGVASQARGHKDFAAYLRGYAAYARMVQPELGQRWVERVEALLSRGEP